MISIRFSNMNFLIIIISFNFNLIFGNYTNFMNHEDNDDLTRCIRDVIEFVSKTHQGGYINLVYNKGYDHITDQILEYVHKNTISKMITLNVDNNNEDDESNQMKYDNSYLGYLRLMLILTNTTQNVIDVINKLNGTIFYETRSRVMIILTSTPKPADLDEMFKLFWSKKFPFVTCLFLDKKIIKTYSFNPFLDQFLQDHSTKNVTNLFDNTLQDINGKKMTILLLRYDERDKIIMKKHPNGTIEWDGSEIKLLTNIIYKMNGSVELIPVSNLLFPGERDPWRQTNDLNSTKATIETKKRILKAKNVDLLSCEEIIIAAYATGVTESLYPHFTDDLKIVIRRSPPIPYFKYLFLVYNYKVWWLYVATFIIGTIVWCITGSNLYPSWVSKLINLIRILSGGSLPQISKNHAERIFISVYLIFSLIMSTAFTSNLASVLMHNKYYPNIDTLDELQTGGYRIIGYATQIRELRQAFNNTPKYPLFERMMQMPPQYSHIEAANNNMTDFLFKYLNPVIATNRRAIYTIKHRIFKDMFHIIKESPLPNYTAFNVPLGSPYRDRFNSILRRIIESGLYLFWIEQHSHYYILKGIFFKPDETNDRRTEAKSITIHHLQAAFLIFLIGLIGSVIAFMIELIINKIKYFNNRTFKLKY